MACMCSTIWTHSDGSGFQCQLKRLPFSKVTSTADRWSASFVARFQYTLREHAIYSNLRTTFMRRTVVHCMCSLSQLPHSQQVNIVPSMYSVQ
jgi:hypothetical protein